jgi:hypothetical protein
VQQNIADYLRQSGNWDRPQAYLVWRGDHLPYVEQNSTVTDSSAPTDNSTSSGIKGLVQADYHLDTAANGDDASFRLAVFPGLLKVRNSSNTREDTTWVYVQLDSENPAFFGRLADRPLLAGADNSTVLHCGMVQSSYNITFSYINGEQHIDFVGDQHEASSGYL